MHSNKIVFVLFLGFLSLLSFIYDGCAPLRKVMTAEESSVPTDSADVGAIMETPTDWIDDHLTEMSLEEKVGQMITVRTYGYYTSDESDQFQRLRQLVIERKIGGVCVFQGDVHTAAVLANRLQALAHVPLLISADFEWGASMRLRRATRFPEAMAVGATRDTLLAHQMGLAIAQEARAMGIHQVYAPVVDVNVNPDNPVINTRSFGSRSKLVADMGSSFIRGLQEGRVIATAKHFPGHGDTHIDSHFDLPIINHPRERLDSVELYPFRRAVESGVTSIMIGHIAVPAFEPNKRIIPATLSTAIVDQLLKNTMGFEGLIVTDAMEMLAITKGFGVDTATIMAIDAGSDMILLPDDEEAAFRAILNAIRSGRISEDRINHSVRKILATKQWVGLDEIQKVDVEALGSVVGNREHLHLAKEIARASITLLKNDNILPLNHDSKDKMLNVVVSDAEYYRTEIHRPGIPGLNERVGEYFTAQLRRRRGNIITTRLDPSSNAMTMESIIKQADAANIVCITIFAKARPSVGKYEIPQHMVDAVNRLISLKKPTILIAMGSPYILRAFPNGSAYVCSYSDAESATEATIEVLFGEIPTRGRLPVAIPDLFDYGSGILSPQLTLRQDLPEDVGFDHAKFLMLDSINIRAIRDSVFPGSQLVVVKDGAIVANKAFGTLEYSSQSRKVDTETMFDIASLTKVVATTTAIMKLYEEGSISLDDPVVKHLPEFGNRGKEKISISNLLVHNAGLPAFKRLFLTCQSAEEVLDSVFNTELIYQPGDSTVYSDFGFIILGKLVEKLTGMSLDKYVRTTFFEPLGMTRTMFLPPESLWTNIAPTEVDTLWRKILVRGVVHDENAHALGGISGHAGLFSPASDLAIFMQMLMNGGKYGGRQYLKPETIKLFTTKRDTKSTRALGWDTKSINGYSSAGKLFSALSFGHTGFTGTSIWSDPERKIFVILLSNRVYPTRNNTKIMKIRPGLYDLIIKSLQ